MPSSVVDISQAVKPSKKPLARDEAEFNSHMTMVNFLVRNASDRTTAEHFYARLVEQVRYLSREHGFKLP